MKKSGSCVEAAKVTSEPLYTRTKQQCPLCAAAVADELERIRFDQIWQSLTADWKATFSKDVMDRHTPATETVLRKCRRCGLQYFDPACPGDDHFYRELTTTSATYYSSDKWDFHEAAKALRPGDVVLDIACGSGSFLKIVAAKGFEAVGIDTNPAAVSAASSQSLSAYCVNLPEYARNHIGRFQVVTAFQVVEHIAEVQPFIRSALACLMPGGKLILTVPNRLRRFGDTFEPLDCPPHHLSRWSSEQFRWLAEFFECQIVDVRHEPATMDECRALLRRRIAGTQAESLWARLIARIVFGPALYSFYRRQGWLDQWRLWRMSVMCVLQKPR